MGIRCCFVEQAAYFLIAADMQAGVFGKGWHGGLRKFKSGASTRSARLGLRATPEQETVLRRAAEVAHKSLTDFILDAAYQAAEQTLLDQRLFMVSGSQYQALLDMLDRPESDNPGLAHLFSRQPVWAGK